jgi:septum formation inhibitor MinC
MSKEMMIRIATKQMQAEFIKIAGLLKELDKQLPVAEATKAA